MNAPPIPRSLPALLALLLLLAAGPARAQDRHTVRIENGVVFVDGRRVPSDELPASLRTDQVRLDLEFTGHARFHLDGAQYGVVDGRIVEMPVDEDGLVIFFRDDAGGVVEMPSPEGTVRRFRLDGPVNPTIGTYLEVLDEQARAFERFGAQLAERQSRDTETLARQLRDEAEQTAIMVRAFPRVEFQTYLDGLQHRDQHLYDRLLREQRMEVASADLARRVFAAPDEPTRQSLTESLRGQLEEIFELKQQNRRDEIGQLELQLRELREQLSERERNRDAIISRRLESLVGRPHR